MPDDPLRLDASRKKTRLRTVYSVGSRAPVARSDARVGHLQIVLLDELERYASAHDATKAMPIARRVVSELCAASVSDSVSGYFELEKLEAEGHVRDLARALNDERKLQRDRSELWRQAAHDLRGHVGAVMMRQPTQLSAATEAIREKFLSLLQRSNRRCTGCWTT